MRNLDLAVEFERIASLLEILEDSPFKIRAYRRVARALAALPDPIEAMARQGRLREIPGVGEAIAAKIEQYLATGRIALLDRLREQVPEGVVELMEIPGIGPRTARLLHEQLGVDSLAELDAAARAGRIRQLKGMGERTERAILDGIEQWRQRLGRLALPYALAIAEEALQIVASLAEVQATALAGAVRRVEEEVTAIDLVASAARPGKAVAAIRAALGPDFVAEQGEWPGSWTAAGRSPQGIPIEILVVTPDSFAGALFRGTGPEAHVEGVTRLLTRRGWRWRDLVLEREGEADTSPGGAGVPAEPERPEEVERAIYDRAGLPWIPPEMRWGEDEISRALAGALPQRLVDVSDLRGDLHTHTSQSDGTASAEEMARAAKLRGYEYLAVTDHSPSLAVARGLSVERLAAHRAHLRALAEEMGFPVLAGVEVDIRGDGTLDYPDEVLASLEWVVASIHSKFRLGPEAMTRRLVAACEHPCVLVLGHPTGRLLGRRAPYDVDLEQVLACASRTRTAMEINASPDRLDLDARWARRARELGVPVVISTDAHSPAQMDYIRYGVLVARRAGLAPSDVLNTLPLEELRQRVK